MFGAWLNGGRRPGTPLRADGTAQEALEDCCVALLRCGKIFQTNVQNRLRGRLDKV